MRGGGEVEIVTLTGVEWSNPPERDEAGSPNTVGAVALAAALCQLEAVGMDQVAQHEAELTAYALRKLAKIQGIHIYGGTDPDQVLGRLGVIPFQLEGMSHFLLAAILGYEFGIGVRNGCFCAHPYILHLLHIEEEDAAQVRELILHSDRREVPGLVRISFGLYNQVEDIDRLVEALECIARGEYTGEYVQDAASGEYHARDWTVDFGKYFSVSQFVRGGDQ
jgi:selenocysteine lyase/cysteine desulfurase